MVHGTGKNMDTPSLAAEFCSHAASGNLSGIGGRIPQNDKLHTFLYFPSEGDGQLQTLWN